ncbi:MAG: hypothetical protein ACK5O7_04550 [Holosporales bacterium]
MMKYLMILPALVGSLAEIALATEYREDIDPQDGAVRPHQRLLLHPYNSQPNHQPRVYHPSNHPPRHLQTPPELRPNGMHLSHAHPALAEPMMVQGRPRRPYLESSLPLVERMGTFQQPVNLPAPEGEDPDEFWRQLSEDLRALASRPFDLGRQRQESLEIRPSITRYRKIKKTSTFRTTINNAETGQSTVITTTMTTNTYFNPVTGEQLPESSSQITSVVESDL